jgi:hypothetical protein
MEQKHGSKSILVLWLVLIICKAILSLKCHKTPQKTLQDQYSTGKNLKIL